MGLKPNIPREIEPSTNTVFFNIGYTSTFFNATTCIHILNTSLQFIKCLNWTDINQNQIFKSCSKKFFFFGSYSNFFCLWRLVCFLCRSFRFLTIFSQRGKNPTYERKWSETWEADNAFNTKRRKPLRPFVMGGYMGNTWIGTWVVRG